MNSERLFYGNLLECTAHKEVPHFVSEDMTGTTMFGHIETETKPYLNNVLLLKTKNGYYVPVEGLNPIEIAYLYMENAKRIYRDSWQGQHFLSTCSPSHVGEITVDADSLVPYSQTKENVSLLAASKKNN